MLTGKQAQPAERSEDPYAKSQIFVWFDIHLTKAV